MNNRGWQTVLLVVLCMVAYIAPAAAQPDFKQVKEGLQLIFPKDHGAHPEYETEWWYYTGHLTLADGRTFGFQLTFFRVGVDPFTISKSSWQARSLYLAHFALTDDAAGQYRHSEQLRRGAFDDAGAAESGLNVWNGNWSARMNGDRQEISASTPKYALTLALVPTKPLVLQGTKGFSRKAEGMGAASYYYSYTRLAGNGSLTLDGTSYPITSASVWMDREFTSSKLAQGVEGWDWFAVQLNSNEEIMVYQLRAKDGTKSSFSSGMLIAADGTTKALTADEFTIKPLGNWTSDASKITYPATWEVTIPERDYRLTITPTVANQELETPSTTAVTYWEGRATVSGTQHGKAVSGNSYVELVGYKRIR